MRVRKMNIPHSSIDSTEGQSPHMEKRYAAVRRILGGTVAVVCLVFAGSAGALAQVSSGPLSANEKSAGETPVVEGAAAMQSGKPLSELGACVSSKESLDVVLLMDETESLVHEVKDGKINPDRPGADPQHNRVLAAQSFVKQLLERQQDQGFSTNIRIAGFGQNYNATQDTEETYGTWTKLDKGSIGKVNKIIDGARDRTGELYTNYANAIDGAYEEFSRSGSPDSCKLLVTFTDGALTAEGPPSADDRARDRLCSADGIADRLRQADIAHVGIGLDTPENPSDFSLLEAMTAGGACGVLPGRGAFFPADGVGALFAAFRSALSTGGDVTSVTKSGNDFTFVLDNSIDSVRFTGIGLDDLGPNAQFMIVGPDGKELVFDERGSGTVSGADINWSASTKPVQQADGEMRKTGDDWAGPWKLKVRGSSVGDRVFNSVRIQPDLRVKFGAPNNDSASADSIALRDDQMLTLSVNGSDGKPHALEGTAEADITFTPNGTDNATALAEGIEVGKGKSVEIPITRIKELPANGTVKASVTVTTKGTNNLPGTQLAPVAVSQPLSITPQDMPQIADSVSFTMTRPTIAVDIPVSGPGKVWIPNDAVMNTASTPENFGDIAIGGDHTGVDNAVQVEKGEKKTLPVTLTVDQVKDGLVSGTIPVHVSKLDGSNEQVVNVSARGNVNVPLDKTTFAAALLVALLMALLIPLGLLYLVRKLTAKIPSTPFGAVVIDVDNTGGYPTYDGQRSPHFTIDDAARNQVSVHQGKRVSVRGYTLTVKDFHPNPIASAYVVVEQTPSTNTNGDQKDLRARLPLAVQNESFLAARPDQPGHYDLVVMPRLPVSSTTEIDEICKMLATTTLQRVEVLENQLKKTATSKGEKREDGNISAAARAGQAPELFPDSSWLNPEATNSGWEPNASYPDPIESSGPYPTDLVRFENPPSSPGGDPGAFGDYRTNGGYGGSDGPEGDRPTSQWSQP